MEYFDKKYIDTQKNFGNLCKVFVRIKKQIFLRWMQFKISDPLNND